jgi:hypothetical protein
LCACHNRSHSILCWFEKVCRCPPKSARLAKVLTSNHQNFNPRNISKSLLLYCFCLFTITLGEIW